MIRQLLKDSAVYGLTGVAARLATVLLIPLFTRQFDVADYGRLDLLLSLLLILSTLGGMQIEAGVARFYFDARRRGDHRRLVGTGLLLRLLSGLAATGLCTAVLGGWLVGRQGIGWAHVLPLVVLVQPSHLLALATYVLRLERRSGMYAGIALGEAVTGTLACIAAVVWLDAGVPGVLWALAAARGFWTLLAVAAIRSQCQLGLDRRHAWNILAYGAASLVGVVCIWLQSHSTRLVLAGLLTMTDLGIFGLAAKIAGLCMLADQAFRLAWGPKSMEMIGQPGAERDYARAFELYFVLMFLIAAATGALAPLAVYLLAPEAYFAAALLVPALAMAQLWSGGLAVVGMGLRIAHRQMWLAPAVGAGAAVNIAGLVIGAERWGLAAAGWATLAGTIASALLVLAAAQRAHRIAYRSRVVVSAIGLSLVLPMLLHVLSVSFDATTEHLGLATLERLAVVAAVSLVGCAVWIRPEDKRKLAAWLRRLPARLRRPAAAEASPSAAATVAAAELPRLEIPRLEMRRR